VLLELAVVVALREGLPGADLTDKLGGF